MGKEGGNSLAATEIYTKFLALLPCHSPQPIPHVPKVACLLQAWLGFSVLPWSGESIFFLLGPEVLLVCWIGGQDVGGEMKGGMRNVRLCDLQECSLWFSVKTTGTQVTQLAGKAYDGGR